MTKQALRAAMRAARGAVPNGERRRVEAAVRARALACPRVRGADAVCLYASIGDELDTRPLIDALLSRGDAVYLPRLGQAPGEMTFRRLRGADALEPGRFGVPAAPAGAEPLRPRGKRVTVLMPGLAFDSADGVRLGMGGGYYDRAIAAMRTEAAEVFAAGLCFACQVVPDVPRDPWDLAADAVWCGG